MATLCKSLTHFPAIKYTFDAHVPFINGLQTPLRGCYCYSISAAAPKNQLYQETPSRRSHIFASSVAFTKLLFISPLRPTLPVLFSWSGTRIFQIPENFLFASHQSGEREERATRKQQGSGTCTAEKCARARRKTPAVNPSINGAMKWHCLDIFSKREGKYIYVIHANIS